MTDIHKFTLENGLRVVFHQDKYTEIAAVNVLYDVGSKDEKPDKTGFAHLFEHLMFGGSENIPDYDIPLQEAGGSSNAFTNNDITNYYETLPKNNLETALWLESDRMLKLAFSNKSLNVQKKVVIEEFKQNYFNVPYGDIWLYMRPLAYKVHPYAWATIGKEISHIEQAKLSDVKDFFYKHYAPNNAILTIAGNFEKNYICDMVNKWFGDIKKRELSLKNIPIEPVQTEARFLELNKNVPGNALYKTYHMCKRKDDEYQTVDLLSDILSNGDSSRLFQALVKEQNIFSDIEAYLTRTIDAGLFVISGKLSKNVSYEKAETELQKELYKIQNELVSERELQKVKNKIESKNIFSETDVLNKAINLSFFELIGKAEHINNEIKLYEKVSSESIMKLAKKILTENNSNTIHYKSNQ
jgi:predicted Zn-dependent peptidase